MDPTLDSINLGSGFGLRYYNLFYFLTTLDIIMNESTVEKVNCYFVRKPYCRVRHPKVDFSTSERLNQNTYIHDSVEFTRYVESSMGGTLEKGRRQANDKIHTLLSFGVREHLKYFLMAATFCHYFLVSGGGICNLYLSINYCQKKKDIHLKFLGMKFDVKLLDCGCHC